jgi:hypothetical protein
MRSMLLAKISQIDVRRARCQRTASSKKGKMQN